MPLETFVEKFTNMRFEPAGLTDDPDVRMAQSIMDYVFRRLALDHLDFDTRSFMGIHTAEEPAGQARDGLLHRGERGRSPTRRSSRRWSRYSQGVATTAKKEGRTEPTHSADQVTFGAGAASAREVDVEIHSSQDLLEKFQGKAADAPMCMTCGTKMRPAGSCYVCEGCGSTSGCS